MDYDVYNSEYSKKADNQVRVIHVKERISELDDQIDIEKNKLQELSDIQENVDTITENINICIELLSKSIKGPNAGNAFSDMYNSNKTFQTKVSSSLENDQINTREKINSLYKEKERILEKARNKKNKKSE